MTENGQNGNGHGTIHHQRPMTPGVDELDDRHTKIIAAQKEIRTRLHAEVMKLLVKHPGMEMALAEALDGERSNMVKAHEQNVRAQRKREAIEQSRAAPTATVGAGKKNGHAPR